MLYYMKVDKGKEYLDIIEVTSIDKLSKELKVSWGDLNDYLNNNGDAQWLSCGIRMPFIKNNFKDIYIISTSKEWIEYKNTRYLSIEIMNDLIELSKYVHIYPTVKKNRKKREV